MSCSRADWPPSPRGEPGLSSPLCAAQRDVRDAQGEAQALAVENAWLQDQLHKGATTGPDAVAYPEPSSTNSGRSFG